MKTPLEQTADRIEDAYHEFKGSTEHVSIPTAQEVLNVVSTARTTGHQRKTDNQVVDSVTAHFKSNAVTSVPDAIADIADRHNLEEADREYEYDADTLRSVTFIKTEDAPEN